MTFARGGDRRAFGFFVACSIMGFVVAYSCGLIRGRREGREAAAEDRRSESAAGALASDAASAPARSCWSSEPDYASGFELAAAEARSERAAALELEDARSWPPIDVEHHLCVRWARDDPEAMPVRVVSDHPMMREQRATQATDDAAPTGDAVLVDRNWIGRSGTCRVVEVNHPRAVPIREAREGEPAFRVAFVRPEPGERAEWADPRGEELR